VILRRFLTAITGLILFIGLYLGAAVIGGAVGNGAAIPAATNDLYRVGLIVGPIHTDLLIPLTPELRARFAFAEQTGVPVNDPDAEWLVIGWGARDFYTSVGSYADLSGAAVAKGIIGDTSVLRVDVAGRITDYTGIDLLALTPDQFAALTDAILADFARTAEGVPIPLSDAGFTLSDSFFAGKDRFHLFLLMTLLYQLVAHSFCTFHCYRAARSKYLTFEGNVSI
jgi:uncharacterized protein (TIGR02117 family)